MSIEANPSTVVKTHAFALRKNGNTSCSVAELERELERMDKALGGIGHKANELGLSLPQAANPAVQNNDKTVRTGLSKAGRVGARSSSREAFVLPILEEKGWSIHRLALEAEVDFHTVNDYLKGKTRPNRSTRAQLASALGVHVQKRPQ